MTYQELAAEFEATDALVKRVGAELEMWRDKDIEAEFKLMQVEDNLAP
jgi:hypothetical protein